MVKPTERIEVRKIFVGKATLFGLLFGLILGLVAGVFIFLTIVLGSEVSIAGFSVGAGAIGIGIVFALGIVVFYAITGAIGALIFSLLYNFISLFGGMMHLGLAEYTPKGAVVQSQQVGMNSR